MYTARGLTGDIGRSVAGFCFKGVGVEVVLKGFLKVLATAQSGPSRKHSLGDCFKLRLVQ